MAIVEGHLVYDELLDVLAKHAPANELLSFQLSPARQQHLDELLAKNDDGQLTVDESAGLDTFEQFEHLVRLLKARVRGRQSP